VKIRKIKIINLTLINDRKQTRTHECFYLPCNESRESMITYNMETGLQRLSSYLCGNSTINNILFSPSMLLQGATPYKAWPFQRVFTSHGESHNNAP